MAVRSQNMVPSTASQVLIKVEESANAQMAGRLYSPYLGRGAAFADVVELANRLDDMFDEMQFPQAAMSYRQFGGKAGPASRKPDGAVEPIEPGEPGVFRVHVQFRQNADWQGTVAWAGGPPEQRFRSTLELFMLMDSALAEL